MNQVQNIQFHGQTVPVFTQSNQHYVAMKPICENIGLDWSAQYRKIQRNAVLNAGIAIMATPEKNNGGSQQSICLKLDLLNGWLFTVEANKVKPQIRERLLQYQAECFAVLNAHFNRPVAQPPLLPPAQDKLPPRDELLSIANLYGDLLKAAHNWGDIALDAAIEREYGKRRDNASYAELVRIVHWLRRRAAPFIPEPLSQTDQAAPRHQAAAEWARQTDSPIAAALLAFGSNLPEAERREILSQALYDMAHLQRIAVTVAENREYNNENRNLADYDIKTLLFGIGKLFATLGEMAGE